MSQLVNARGPSKPKPDSLLATEGDVDTLGFKLFVAHLIQHRKIEKIKASGSAFALVQAVFDNNEDNSIQAYKTTDLGRTRVYKTIEWFLAEVRRNPPALNKAAVEDALRRLNEKFELCTHNLRLMQALFASEPIGAIEWSVWSKYKTETMLDLVRDAGVVLSWEDGRSISRTLAWEVEMEYQRMMRAMRELCNLVMWRCLKKSETMTTAGTD
jgi:hypothetical protein